jgi:AraC family transcriptional regulator
MGRVRYVLRETAAGAAPPRPLAGNLEPSMPHRRTIRYASPLVAWHELVLEESASDWSITYRAESPRLLVPGTRWIEAEQRGRRFFCDALAPLVLTPEVPYRTRQPFGGQRSVVLIFECAEGGVLQRASRLRFDPSAQWQLAQCRAALDGGVQDRLHFEEAVLALLPEARADEPAPAHSAEIGRPTSSRISNRTVDRAVERARELIASDPSSSDSLYEMAQAVAASPFHLARCFKRTNGIGLHRYRTCLRMALALSRLGDGEDDLSRLALDLGYSSHSHFTAAFGRHFGVSPSSARQVLATRARIR